MAELKENFNNSGMNIKKISKLPVWFDSKLSFRPKLIYALDEKNPHQMYVKYVEGDQNYTEHASSELNILDFLVNSRQIKIEWNKIFVWNDLLVTINTNKDWNINHWSYSASPINTLYPTDPKSFLERYLCPWIEVYIEWKWWVPYNKEDESIIIFNSQTPWRINKELLEKHRRDGVEFKIISEDDKKINWSNNEGEIKED